MKIYVYAQNRVMHLPSSDEDYQLNEIMSGFSEELNRLMIHVSDDRAVILHDGQEIDTLNTEGESFTRSGVTISAMYTIRQVFWIQDKTELWVSGQTGAAIQLADIPVEDTTIGGFLLKRSAVTDKWELIVQGNGLYTMGRLLDKGTKFVLDNGQTITVGTTQIRILEKELWVYAAETSIKSKIPYGQIKSVYDKPDNYPAYRRSPRLILRSPDEQLTVPQPPAKAKRNDDGLAGLILPPALSFGATIAMAIFMHRGLLVLVTGSVTLVTTAISIRKYFKDKKIREKEEDQAVEAYEQILNERNLAINEANAKQRKAKEYHYPDISVLNQMVATTDSRLYEKTPQQFDFLTYRLGLGEEESSSQLKFEAKPETAKTVFGKMAQRVFDEGRILKDMPIIGTLNSSVVGYVGQRKTVLEQLQLLVMQIATFQSYHDVEFVTIFPEEEKQLWDWMRWLPHSQLHDINVRGFVYNQRTRDQVMGSVYSLLKERKNALSEASRNQQPLFLPRLVILVTDEKLIMDHVIMEYLQEDPQELGVSLVFTADVRSSLRENVQTVIDVLDSTTGVLVMEDGVVKNTQFRLDHVPDYVDKELFARHLAPIDHKLNLESSIPSMLDFMQMYDVTHVEELAIKDRWEDNQPRKSMAVPIGWRADHDVVELDLHEKEDGPHGLLAGTTGSGKTEVIKDLMTSLAVNFKPTNVAFLPIDFKGGALADDLAYFPHTVGAITNLDGAAAMRALTSIDAEMKRRMRVFSSVGVANINDYHKALESGDATEPIPHLVMVSDEFAELKAQVPEFLDALVQTARVGRSLGVHLLLATQKPAGVVNDQIWANSRFRIALKVADAADSKEMLKTPDAADIVETGRGYLQVGNNERYELFQTAYTGADYKPDQEENSEEELAIYNINEWGQYNKLNKNDDTGSEKVTKKVKKQIDVVIDEINHIFDEGDYVRPTKVWLPALKDRVFLADLTETDFASQWQKAKQPLVATLGLMDIPAEQDQRPLELDLSDGHVVLYGSSGYGKSTFIQTMILDLAHKHTPETLHLYLMDFGTNGLLPLRQLPHTADFFRVDEEEKIAKLMTKLTEEIKARKKLLAQKNVANLSLYERATGESLPEIVVVLDGYDGMKDVSYENELNKLMIQIGREGLGVGIHVVLTANRTAAIRSNLSSTLKHRLMLSLLEVGDISGVVGRTKLVPQDRPGAGLVKLDEAVEFQTALPVRGADDLEILDNITAEIKTMNQEWTGQRPKHIPMIPDTLDVESFFEFEGVEDAFTAGDFPLGLDTTTVEPIMLSGNMIVFGQPEDISYQLMVSGLMTLADRSKSALVFDGQNQADVIDFKENILDQLIDDQITNQTIVINHIETFISATNIEPDIDEIGNVKANLLADLLDTENTFILIDEFAWFKRGRETAQYEIKKRINGSMSTMRAVDQNSIMDGSTNSREPALPENLATINLRGSFDRMQYVRGEIDG